MRNRNIIKILNGILIFILFLTCSNGLQAQKVEVETKTSHFLFPAFYEGIVKMKSGELYSANMDYNTVTQEMVFEKNGKRMAFDNLNEIDTIFVNERIFIPGKEVFYEIVVDGAIPLYVQHKCNLLSKGKDIGYGKSQTTSSVSYTEILGAQGIYKFELPDEFYVADATLYLVKKDNEIVNVNNKRKFLKAFPEKNKEIEGFIKTNKLKLKNQSDFEKLVRYCNSLYN